MFLKLTGMIVLFFIVILILIPVIVNVFKNNLYDEWRKIWQADVESQKRELAMLMTNKNKNKLVKKTRDI